MEEERDAAEWDLVCFDENEGERWRGVAAIWQGVIRAYKRQRSIALVIKIGCVVSTLALGY